MTPTDSPAPFNALDASLTAISAKHRLAMWGSMFGLAGAILLLAVDWRLWLGFTLLLTAYQIRQQTQ